MIDTTIKFLKQQGIKITYQRRMVIAALAEGNEPVSARQVYQKVQSQIPDISLDTVYRTLQTLVQCQAAVPLHLLDGSAVRYELQPEGHPHHHLVCLACGRSYCLEHCPLTPVSEAEKINFDIRSHALEFYGYCSDCSMEKRRAK